MARGQVLEPVHEESTPLVLVPASSQYMKAKVHLQLHLSVLDIFSGVAQSRSQGCVAGKQEWGGKLQCHGNWESGPEGP